MATPKLASQNPVTTLPVSLAMHPSSNGSGAERRASTADPRSGSTSPNASARATG